MVILVIIAGLSIRSYGGRSANCRQRRQGQVQELSSLVRTITPIAGSILEPGRPGAARPIWPTHAGAGICRSPPSWILGPADEYAYPSTHGLDGPDISSAGPDRQSGTDDDIGNWL